MELQQTRDSTKETKKAREGKAGREWRQRVTGRGERIGHLPLSRLVWWRLADSYYVLFPQTLAMSSLLLGPFPHPYLTSHLCLLHLTLSHPGPPPTQGCLTCIDTTANPGHRKKEVVREGLSTRIWEAGRDRHEVLVKPPLQHTSDMKEPTRKWHGFPAAPWNWTDCVHRASSHPKPIPTVHTNIRHKCEETRVPSSLSPCSSGFAFLEERDYGGYTHLSP